ncbi:helix-turn-helix domain-containing protein [Streptomyces sp. NPDC060366]|uniref:helix-turn-helix domain-containing protein n=1 Tax=Streptomyces sp. NPDC060366 TaxID=3347105 RepID=UPI00365C5CBA
MNTTTAAQTANVTVATIRTWARNGVIAATKTAGRWIIDTASLARRIAIGAMKRPAKPAVFTTESMVAIGGSRWQKNGMDRVYINDWAAFAGLEVTTYGTGNISWAAWDGDKIANRQAGLFLGAIDKVWFDAADGKLHCRYGYSTPRIATREDIWEMTVDGIRAAITAL